MACVSVGCRTQEIRRPGSVREATIVVEHKRPVEAHRIAAGDADLGHLIRFEGERGDETIWIVRNRWNQDLGWIDRWGRAFRFVPHEEDARWMSTGTVPEGVASILRSEFVPELVLVDLEEISTSTAGSRMH